MLKTGVRKYDIFRTYYWNDATLVGQYRMPQLKATQSIPHDVIGFNERKSIRKPQNHWVDFFIDDALFESFWNHPERSFSNLKKYEGIHGLFYVARTFTRAEHMELHKKSCYGLLLAKQWF